MRFIALKTCDGTKKGKLAFYCRMLDVSRQGFYDYLETSKQPWKYQGIADAMKAIRADFGWRSLGGGVDSAAA